MERGESTGNMREIMGQLSDRLRSTPPADKSRDAGSVPGNRFRAECERRWERLAAQLGDRYAGCTLENFQLSPDAGYAGKQRHVLDRIRGFNRRPIPGQNIILYGPSGSGKDHLLAALLRPAVLGGTSVRWISGMRLLARLRDIIGANDSEEELLDRWSEPSILAISDPLPPFGELTQFQATFLLELVDRRYRDRKGTWVTINVRSGDEAEPRMGVQIVERLRDGGLALHCDWPSFRKSQQESAS